MEKYVIGYDKGVQDKSCLSVRKGNKIIYITRRKIITRLILKLARIFKIKTC